MLTWTLDGGDMIDDGYRLVKGLRIRLDLVLSVHLAKGLVSLLFCERSVQLSFKIDCDLV